MITGNNGELDSFHEIPDDWHEIASIDYNVMHVDIVINICNLSVHDYLNAIQWMHCHHYYSYD